MERIGARLHLALVLHRWVQMGCGAETSGTVGVVHGLGFRGGSDSAKRAASCNRAGCVRMYPHGRPTPLPHVGQTTPMAASRYDVPGLMVRGELGARR